MTRPPERSSSVAAILAINAGLRKEAHITSDPSSTRGTTGASAASVVHASRMPSSGSPGVAEQQVVEDPDRVEPDGFRVLGEGEGLREGRDAARRGVALGEGQRDADAHRAESSDASRCVTASAGSRTNDSAMSPRHTHRARPRGSRHRRGA